MASNKQTSSSSALVAATNQAANGRTTRAMKAKENAGNSLQTDTNNTAAVDGTLTKAAMPAKEIDRTSHLHVQPGKRELDDLEKLLKAQQAKPFLWGTQIPAVSKEDMASDFEAMGYSSAAIKDLINRQEPIRIDGFSQRPCVGHGKTVAGTGTSPKKSPKRKPATRAQPKRKAAPPPPPAPAPALVPSPPSPEAPVLGRVARGAASKKRKADEISAGPAPETAREPSAAAEEPVAASESVGGEGKQRKKRRHGRPKISAARVDDSGSE